MQLILSVLLLHLSPPAPVQPVRWNSLEHRPAAVERLSYPDLFSQPKPLEVTL